MKHNLWLSLYLLIKLLYMYVGTGRKFKQDKKLKLNMQRTSVNFNSELKLQTKPD